MLAINQDPAAMVTLEANVAQLSSSAHFVRGFMRAKHIPDCPAGFDREEDDAVTASTAAECKAKFDA